MCSDTDGDTCEDCSSGVYDTSNDGLDYDSDSTCDATDTDDDNDSILDGVDDCEQGDLDWSSTPLSDHDTDGCQDDSSEDTDDDNDGIADDSDACQTSLNPHNDNVAGLEDGFQSNATSDYDTDGCEDDSLEDTDDDNDGVADDPDDCELSNNVGDYAAGAAGFVSDSSSDWDSDGCEDADVEDVDDDNDSQADGEDDCDPDSGVASDLNWTSSPDTDYDDDGCQDDTNGDGLFDDGDEDADDDNDGVDDVDDDCPAGELGWTSSGVGEAHGQDTTDYDGDGCLDDSSEDTDDDNDGAADADDTDDNNIYECSDNDQDGCEDCLSGTYNLNDDGPDNDGDGQCDVGDVDLALSANANLISFYALPENNDYSISNIFGDLGDNIQKVIGEGDIALNLGNETWVGSLDDVAADDGYWVVLESDASLQVQGLPTSPVVYGLHPGNNLVSYSYAAGQAIDGAFGTASSAIDAVYGAGTMALNTDSGWDGSLDVLNAGSGYWLLANSAVTFEYEEPTSGGARLAADPIAVPEEYRFEQSVNQYFYFVTEASIQDYELNQGDWIVAYNNDVVVGSRMYKAGGMIDLPIMGFDASTENTALATVGYCESGDMPTIMVHQSNGDVFEMDVESISGSLAFQNIGHAVVSLTDHSLPNEVTLHGAYPNPFNPSTMIEYEIPSEMHVNLSVYDIRGRLVTELVNEIQPSNYDTYKVVWNAGMQSSGVYFVHLTAGSSVETQKIMLVK